MGRDWTTEACSVTVKFRHTSAAYADTRHRIPRSTVGGTVDVESADIAIGLRRIPRVDGDLQSAEHPGADVKIYDLSKAQDLPGRKAPPLDV